MQGVRVHNGKLFNPEEGTPYVWNFTDSDGAYTLSNLRAGTYTNGAFLFGYTTSPAGSDAAIVLTDTSATNVDFRAKRWPRLIVSVKAPTLKEGEGTEFVFTRTGPTNAPLTVGFTASGTAQARSDYPDFFLRRVTISAGAASASVALNTFADNESEGEETITIRAELPTESQRTRIEPDGSTSQLTVFYPGWELRPRNGQLYWFQTDPEYLVTTESSATVTIQDGSAAPQYEVSVIASDVAAIETPKFESSFTLTRQGSLAEPLTVFFELAGTAINAIDYDTIQGSATIPASQDFVIVPVSPIPDSEPEGTESVLVGLRPNGNYTIGTGEASVFIKDTDSLPTSLAVKRRADGSLEIHVAGQAGQRYVLQESLDLTRWTPIKTNLLFASPLIFKLPATPGSTERFYRTAVQ